MRDLGITEGQTLTIGLPPESLRVFDADAAGRRMTYRRDRGCARTSAAHRRGRGDARRHPGAGRVPDARHRPAAGDAAVEELPGRRRALRRPRQLRALFRDAVARRLAVEQLLGGGAGDRHRRAAGIPLCLRPHAHAHARQGLLPGRRAAAAVRAVAAVGHLADLHLRQPGLPQELAVRRQRVRADRHHPGAGVLLLPARDDDPDHRARARRRAALRGRRSHGHAALARVSHRHAAGRALRPDIGDVRRLHAGGDGFRHRQGDRRPVQRAGDGCLQAGDRPAELRDGRGGGLRPAGAGRGRLRPRPADPAAPGRAAVGARRAARAARQSPEGRGLHWSTAW